MGAPERTAAGVVSPGSLPSITLAGTGEKFLCFVSAARASTASSEEGGGLRGAVVYSNGIVWIVSSHRFRKTYPFSSEHDSGQRDRRVGYSCGYGALISCQCRYSS